VADLISLPYTVLMQLSPLIPSCPVLVQLAGSPYRLDHMLLSTAVLLLVISSVLCYIYGLVCMCVMDCKVSMESLVCCGEVGCCCGYCCHQCSVVASIFPSLPPLGIRCGPEEFQCQNRRQCIPYWSVCNREQDCNDGSDESTTLCRGEQHI